VMDIEKTEKRALLEIRETTSKKELEKIKKRYLGKKGEISEIFKFIPKADPEERAELGKKANRLKAALEKELKKKEAELKKKKKKRRVKSFDPTLPGKRSVSGTLHPITRARKRACKIFREIGFSVVLGPDIESVWYNFDALNFPEEHPARDMQDTLFIKQEGNPPSEERLLMRTHTSPVQIRYMEKNQPPLKIIVPGRVYRNETTDATHEINFYQLEGLMVDKEISVANFRAIITEFVDRFFGKDVEVRLRPSFFPFTEPSFEVDMSCSVCKKKGCSVCSNTGWLEVLGAGMVHPNVLKNAGLNPKNWQGFAFGMGFDRLIMIKYGIDDVRLMYGGDLRFLNQFRY